MSDDVETQDNRINDFIDSIASGNFNQSEKLFNDLLQDKMNDAMEDEKIDVAHDIYNSVDQDESADDDDEDLELPDE